MFSNLGSGFQAAVFIKITTNCSLKTGVIAQNWLIKAAQKQSLPRKKMRSKSPNRPIARSWFRYRRRVFSTRRRILRFCIAALIPFRPKVSGRATLKGYIGQESPPVKRFPGSGFPFFPLQAPELETKNSPMPQHLVSQGSPKLYLQRWLAINAGMFKYAKCLIRRQII